MLKPVNSYISGFFIKNIRIFVQNCCVFSKTEQRTFSTTAVKSLRKRRKKKAEEHDEDEKCFEESLKSIREPPKLSFPFDGLNLLSTENDDSQLHNITDSNADVVHKEKLHFKENVKYLPSKCTLHSTSIHNDTLIDKEESIEGRYYLFRGSDMEKVKLPSVTTVLQATLPQSAWFGLRNWRKNMIEEHGEKGYRRIRSETIQNGKNFHQLLEERLRMASDKTASSDRPVHQSATLDKPAVVNGQNDKPATAPEKTEEHQGMLVNGGPFSLAMKTVTPFSSHSLPTVNDSWDLLSDIHETFTSLDADAIKYTLPIWNEKNYQYSESVKSVLRDVTDVMVIEGVVRHEKLGYCGTVDCVAHYKGELCVIEWKTSNKPKPQLKDLHDYPLQISAYAGALNSDQSYRFKVNKGLIVVAYPTGSEAHVHCLDSELCHEYWNKWLDRLNQFQTQFAHDLTNIHI